MSTFDRIEAGMPRLLTELADPRTPDYLDNVVSRTAGSRQRPGWTFLERWLPVSVATIVGTTRSSVPWRAVGAIVLLIVALIGGALLVMGSRQRPLPAPFGPALPGLVVYEADGDLFTADPATGGGTPLVTGPTVDSQPRWSPDGTRVAFEREVAENQDSVYVVDAAGAGLTLVTPQPLTQVRDVIFSPDGKLILVTSSRDARDVITIAQADGSGAREMNSTDAASLPFFRPPDGRSFMFVTGTKFSTQGQGLSAYDVETGVVSSIVAPIPGAEIVGRPEYSPDGTRIAYATWIPTEDRNARVFTANADGSGVLLLNSPPDICCEAMPTWSNDGTRLAITRWYDPYGEVIAVVPWDRGGVGIEFEIPALYRGIASWSPDDRWLLVAPLNNEDGSMRSPQVLLDVESGTQKPINWVSKSDPSVQRLAPRT